MTSETTKYFSTILNVNDTTKTFNTPAEITKSNITKNTAQNFATKYAQYCDSSATLKDAFYLERTKIHVD